MRSVADLTPAERGKSHQLHKLANEIRGKFLTGATWIEILLSDILATYFCTSEQRRLLFFSVVAVEMSLYRKTELLVKLLRFEYPEMLMKYPRLESQLQVFRSFRNLVAHSHIDTSKPALGTTTQDEVTFIYYRNGKVKHRKVTRKDAQQRAKEANSLRDALVVIQSHINAKCRG